MIKSFLKRGFQRFGRRYNYDTAYMDYIADTSTSAALRLSMLPLISQFRGPEPARDVWAGAILASTLEGDCGPCAQLVTDMAIEARVPVDQLALCIQGNAQEAGDVGLGFRFSQAAIADHPQLEMLRGEIETRFGASAVIAVSFAASSGRMYPVLKRGLGFGHACSRLSVQDKPVAVQNAR